MISFLKFNGFPSGEIFKNGLRLFIGNFAEFDVEAYYTLACLECLFLLYLNLF